MLLLTFITFGTKLSAAPPPADQTLEAKFHQVGKRSDQDKSQSPRLDIPFTSAPNATEFTIQLTHRDVVQPWFVEVNGRRLGPFPLSYRNAEKTFFTIPAGTLRPGSNTISIVADDFGKEISVGNFLLFRKPLRDLLNLRTVTVSVTDETTGQPVPARVSVLTDRGAATEIFNVSATNVAVRPGFIYTVGTPISFDVAAGKYDFYATRGMEWSLAHKTISVSSAQPVTLDLRLRRQVDTTGFVAADTHLHTITFSGHGNATVEERMVTLAGEGVELAVATDHNHHTDYRPYQSRLELNRYFTPVTGNEVTTKNGHFNAFPMPVGGTPPNHQESDWVKLVNDIRLKGAQVVIWNHPFYPDPENNPLTKFNFNRASGDCFSGPILPFNGMELINSSSPSVIKRPVLDTDRLQLLTEWFAILNHGQIITGVGASDSHTAQDPAGQGRTYVRSSTDDPARINVDEMVRNFLAGDTTVSYGIFADMTVNGRQHMGEHAAAVGGKVDVSLRVASAEWIKPRRAIVFLNGLPVAEKTLTPVAGKPFDERVSFSIPVPKHDCHLVCAVFGDGANAPYWPTLAKFTAAVVNPVYLDGDGDGKYQSPRATAQQKLAATDGSLKAVWTTIEKSDDALAGQMLGLLYLNRDADFVRQLDARVRTAAPKREVYRKFLANSPLIVVKAKPAKAKAKSASD